MAKKVTHFIKLQIPAGAANPAPPVGPALGAAQVNIMQFCQAFNAATSDKKGDIIPVEITVYEDRTFDFVCKTPPAAQLIKKELGLKSGSGVPQRDKVGQLSQEQLTKIAEIKMPDLNANDIEAAKKIVAGTARSMGVTIAEEQVPSAWPSLACQIKVGIHQLRGRATPPANHTGGKKWRSTERTTPTPLPSSTRQRSTARRRPWSS